ncbi:BlaR1 peptidase M56 [Rubripirellula obstinata]|uniref:BlaR1 peptidase M56 n=2 Tax=Rubripirellula obstinata TaxID=406547 RepID=A0A5B1CLQ6_9BACT|nr:BlaR1 peptidase M56 [Rubripirellula obstinata]
MAISPIQKAGNNMMLPAMMQELSLGFDSVDLFNWLLGGTLGATLIAVIAIIVGRYCDRPAIAHRLWLLALIRIMLPPMFAFPLTVWAPSSLRSLPDAALSNSGLQNLNLDWGACLIAVWCLGSLMMLVWVCRSASRMRRLIEYRGRFDLSATKVLHQSVADPLETSLPKNFPEVWLVDAFVSPMLYCDTAFGFSRSCRLSDKPIIVFPRTLWNQMDRQSRVVLLKHELAHWSRRDQWVRWIEVIAMVFLWWHPLVWIARRQIESCEERCCDAAATTGQPEQRRVYAEAILQTLDFLCEPFEPNRSEVQARPLGSGLSSLPIVEHRLYKIMRPIGLAGQNVLKSAAIGTCCIAAMIVALTPVSPAISIQIAPAASAKVTADRPLGVKSNVEMEILRRKGDTAR